ncbi:MAG: hypothetical protein JSU63_11120 [Phycisphaerales bacterium]|nr:MAG: hypothetical protein JSU63_11120 [Phycisphaerales bacterium]
MRTLCRTGIEPMEDALHAAVSNVCGGDDVKGIYTNTSSTNVRENTGENARARLMLLF